MLLIIFVQLKRIFSCVLTLIQNAMNFGCITIEKVGEWDLVNANGLILKIILMIIWFVGKRYHIFFSKIVGLLQDICLLEFAISAFLVSNSYATSVLLKINLFCIFFSDYSFVTAKSPIFSLFSQRKT